MRSRDDIEDGLRAPIWVLDEILERTDDPTEVEHASVVFRHMFEGREVLVSDFHKASWGTRPDSETDSRYVWAVHSDDWGAEKPFCEWLSSQVLSRLPDHLADDYRWPIRKAVTVVEKATPGSVAATKPRLRPRK